MDVLSISFYEKKGCTYVQEFKFVSTCHAKRPWCPPLHVKFSTVCQSVSFCTLRHECILTVVVHRPHHFASGRRNEIFHHDGSPVNTRVFSKIPDFPLEHKHRSSEFHVIFLFSLFLDNKKLKCDT